MKESAGTAIMLDPHPLWLDGLQRVLEKLDIAVLGKACAIEQALSMIEIHRPDIFLIETGIQGAMTGPAVVHAARQRVPSLRVIALSGSSEPADMDAALEAGALAYIVKTAALEDVAAMIRQVSDSIFTTGVCAPESSAAPQGEYEPIEGAALTPREREILALVAEGYSNRELARMLWVTEQTVKFHLSNTYRKLGATNRTEASRWAHKHRLLDGGEGNPFARTPSPLTQTPSAA